MYHFLNDVNLNYLINFEVLLNKFKCDIRTRTTFDNLKRHNIPIITTHHIVLIIERK